MPNDTKKTKGTTEVTAKNESSLKKAKAAASKKDTKKLEKAKKKSERSANKAEKATEKPKKKNALKFIGGLLFSKMAKGGAKELRTNADEVNKLNIFPVPDGDTGDNMRMTIESGVAAIEDMNTDNLADVMKALSRGMLLGARGNSGVILSQFFAGIAKGLETAEDADPATFGAALELGVAQAYSSVMTPTEGTILTVAREAVEYAVSKINPHSTIRSLFSDLVDEMHASLERTPERLSVLKEAGVVDSGGAGLFYIMDGFNRVLNGKKIPDAKDGEAVEMPMASAPVTPTSFGPDSDMTFAYCTELLVQLQNRKVDIDEFDVEELKAFLATLGDSIVAFKTDSIVKIHVHTFTPEIVLGHCREFGEFISVKIENMSLQHTELEAEKNEDLPPRKRYGVVAVSNGPGINSLFTELGADVIVEGGQTQNPSTSDFIEAFKKINADDIFVLPNNSNIIMAAEQAAELCDGARVHVIPSKNLGTGYVALSSIDYENPDCNAIISDVTEAMKRVTTGYASPAIRDADMDGVHVTNGDTIGIVDKKIIVSESDRATALKKLASTLLDVPEKFMLTIFTGADATIEDTVALQNFLNESYSDYEVYFIEGGQEIYPYIFMAE